MKKTLALVLAIVMALGCMSITAFALDKPFRIYQDIKFGRATGDTDPSTEDLRNGHYSVNVVVCEGDIDEYVQTTPFSQIEADSIVKFNYSHEKAKYNDTYSQYVFSYKTAIGVDDNGYIETPNNYISNETLYFIVFYFDGGEIPSECLIHQNQMSNGEEAGISLSYTRMAGNILWKEYIAPAPSTSKTGTTEITAIKAAPFSYEIVFPTTVPTITAAGVTEIGAPSVKNVTGATEKTVISYTATGTQLTLEGDSKTMTTSYYTDSEGKTALTDDAIEVYKNSAVIASPTSLYVGVAEDDWNAADAGTYHATVTFNFSAKEKEPGCEVDTETNTQLYRVVKIDDENVYVAMYSKENTGFDAFCSMGFGLPKDNVESILGTEYAVGDCFHELEDDSVEKCIAPETHGLINEGNTFTSKYASTGNPAVVYFVIAGTTYAVNDGVLSVHYGDQSHNLSGRQCSWTLDGNPLSDGDTGTISEGNAFVGTDLPD